MSMYYVLGSFYVCIRVSILWLDYEQQQWAGTVTLIPYSGVLSPEPTRHCGCCLCQQADLGPQKGRMLVQSPPPHFCDQDGGVQRP